MLLIVVAVLIARDADARKQQVHRDRAEGMRLEAAQQETNVLKHEAGAAEVEAQARKQRAEADELDPDVRRDHDNDNDNDNTLVADDETPAVRPQDTGVQDPNAPGTPGPRTSTTTRFASSGRGAGGAVSRR